jgi:predicted enzyme related to lactoylglutathione lyase
MPARGDLPEGAPAWIDLGARDLDAAVAFYTGVFGWEHMSFGEQFGNYGQFLLGGKPVAGVGPIMGDTDEHAAWGVYLWTTDADGTAARVARHGGTVLLPPDDVPGQGRFLMTADPAGAPIAFWQAYEHTGFTVVGEPGAPVWFELWTNDYDRAVAYYRDVAGWDTHEMPNDGGFRYTTHGEGDASYAGIYDATSDLGTDGKPSWQVYLGTADVDASAARVRELGGTVRSEPEDTPYGRMVGVEDPNGTGFWLMTPS